MTTMNHDSRYSFLDVVGLTAQGAIILINEFLDKLLNLVMVWIGEVVCLIEEISCGVL